MTPRKEFPAKPQCIACVHHPRQAVDMGDGTEVTFCEEHWEVLGERLVEAGHVYDELIASGVHPRFAIHITSKERK